MIDFLRKLFRPDRLEKTYRVEALARSFYADSPGWIPKDHKCRWEDLSEPVRLQYLRNAEMYLQDIENRIATHRVPR